MPAMNLIGRLQTVSDAYCAKLQLRREQASYQIFNDQRRLGTVFAREGGLTVANFEKAMNWFAANWPEDLEWPKGVERPEPQDNVANAPVSEAAA